MSRSYKKHTCATWKSKYARKQANRRWRHTYDMEDAQYSKYKRYYPQWDVIDYVYRYTWEEYWRDSIRRYEKLKMIHPDWEEKYSEWANKYPDEKDEYLWWYQHYKAK